ncbi:TetR/AcrR family transcriptional regulator [Paremcibacter congregatus]|jgi:TetR/AcrR family transcriptional regulator|uniref:TetR/AcrR family transcriptional regulator n=1 Tax=Paremcibacter congregatus TaxID=2043170 RepID=UPI0030EF7C9C|tara:strand:- start:2430 stop:3047 length:618 start_codon:yes stop_codon:yes gene_type:complete
MARKQAEDYDDRRRSILDKAAELFADKGYARSSISELAKACGASKSWLYHYYPSKEAILFDIMRLHVMELVTMAEAALVHDGTPKEKFQILARNFMNIYVNAGSKHVILLNDRGCLPDEMRREILGLQERVVNTVVELVLELNPELDKAQDYKKPVTMAFLGMINWTYIWFRKDGPVSQEQFADLAVEVFMNGFMSLDPEKLQRI